MSATAIGFEKLRRLAESWPRRATVHTHMEEMASPSDYIIDAPDYPMRLVPFADHPRFLEASHEQQQTVLTLAWLSYNERVIAAEEYVANPTFSMIMHGAFPGTDHAGLRQAVQQAHVDEVWHTYMHMMAMRRTREVRGLNSEPTYAQSITYRRLLQAEAEASERWQRDLLKLAWTTVTETSINAQLELLARDKTVQPLHALVARLHARDESAHGGVMVEVMKAIYLDMTNEQRRAFAQMLPKALYAFTEQDLDAWHDILCHAGIPEAGDVVHDISQGSEAEFSTRDISGMRRIVRELEITDLVDYDFGPINDT